MTQIVKSAAEQVAQRLVVDLENGIWKKTLPGLKLLAKRYGVNHETVGSAMKFLEQWGWVEPATPRKSRVIKKSPVAIKSSIKNLLILHHEDASEAKEKTYFRAQIALMWANKYDQFSIVSVSKKTTDAAKKELDKLVSKHGAQAIVLHNLSREWGRAALDTLPTYFLGGALPPGAVEKKRINAFSASFPAELSKAYNTLRKLGHERILFVNKSTGIGMRELVLSIPESPKSSDNLVGLPEDYCVQVYSWEPSVWMEMWQREISRLRPTAIMANEATVISSFYSYCQVASKKIPQDYSILSLMHAVELEYLIPKPLMASYDTDGNFRHFKRWINGGLKDIGHEISDLRWDTNGASIAEAMDS